MQHAAVVASLHRPLNAQENTGTLDMCTTLFKGKWGEEASTFMVVLNIFVNRGNVMIKPAVHFSLNYVYTILRK